MSVSTIIWAPALMVDLPAESADERDLLLIVYTFPDKRYTVIPAYYGLIGLL